MLKLKFINVILQLVLTDDWKGVLSHLKLVDVKPISENSPNCFVTTPTLLLVGTDHPYCKTETAYRSAGKFFLIPGESKFRYTLFLLYFIRF